MITFEFREIAACRCGNAVAPIITDTASAEVATGSARLVADDVPLAVAHGIRLGMSEHHLRSTAQ